MSPAERIACIRSFRRIGAETRQRIIRFAVNDARKFHPLNYTLYIKQFRRFLSARLTIAPKAILLAKQIASNFWLPNFLKILLTSLLD